MGFRGSFAFTPTGVLIISNLVMYAFTSIIGGDLIRTDRSVLIMLGQANVLVMEGFYWQLFTSLFVHINILHLLGNMFFLLIFGIRAEEIFSKASYLTIYFSSGFVGNLLSLVMGPYFVSAGASGAIFGLFGACVIYLRKTVRQSVAGALIYSAYIFIMTLGANVNLLAHFGGLATGLLIGYLLARQSYGAL